MRDVCRRNSLGACNKPNLKLDWTMRLVTGKYMQGMAEQAAQAQRNKLKAKAIKLSSRT